MNVPNDRIGFSKLPENVQQRMDPSLANKYQMGGSVMQRPLFRQMGGPTDMMPQDMMPPPPMGGAPMAPPPMDPAMEAQLMEAENMGAQTGEQIGAQFSQDMMMNLEGAEDYQSLIDGIRGNQLPIDARYQELAGYVGEQDAMATPESVLALTQPTIMMTEEGAMDSGIGELMQGIASDVPMQGPMDEGVGALMAAGAGNTPPVNFRNGGPVEVRGYDNGGVIAKAQAMAPEYQKYFASAMDSEARAAALAEQNEMAKAQMLFDIAGTALNFAGQTEGNTLAERLANSASQTQLTDKIGARSAGMLTAKQAQAAEDRQARMAGLQGALGQAQADDATETRRLEAAALAGSKDVGDIYTITYPGPDGKPISVTQPVSTSQYNALVKKHGSDKVNFKFIPKTAASAANRDNYLITNPKTGVQRFSVVGRDEPAPEGGVLVGNFSAPDLYKTTQVTLTQDVKDASGTVLYKKGTSPNFTEIQLSSLPADSYTQYVAPVSERDIFQKTGLYEKDFESIQAKLTDEDKLYMSGAPVITNQQYFSKFGMSKTEFMALSSADKTELYKLTKDKDRIMTDAGGNIVAIDADNVVTVVHQPDQSEMRVIDGSLVMVNLKTNAVTKLYSKDVKPADPDYRVLRDMTKGVTTIIDLSTASGAAAMAAANQANITAKSTLFSIGNIAADQTPMVKAFNIDGVGNVLSYDEGRTYVNKQGVITSMPTDVTVSPLSDTTAYTTAKNERIMLAAGAQLAKMDEALGLLAKGGTRDNPENLSKQEASDVRDAMEAARNGTGAYASFQALLDNVFGGIVSSKKYQDTQANRQFLRGLIVLGRSALVVNPRFPVAEMAKVEGLFPNVDAIWRSPETEAGKLVELKALAEQQKRSNLEAINSGIQDKSVLAGVLQNQFEIDRLLGLLQGVELVGDTIDPEALQSLDTLIQNRPQAK